MTSTEARRAAGKSANSRGKAYERQLAKYLRSWWPEAERAVAVGFAARGAQRASADPGDIRGVPGTIWDCKSRTRLLSHQQRIDLMLELAAKALNQPTRGPSSVPAPYAILVERRERAQIGDWLASMTALDFVRLQSGPFMDFPVLLAPQIVVSFPLSFAVALLRVNGV